MKHSKTLVIITNKTEKIIWEFLPFHLKKVLHDLSLEYLNCHCYNPCALGPLLGKIRVTWTHRDKHYDTTAVDQITGMATT